VAAVRAAVEREPSGPSVPDQPPEAEQAVALVEVQVSMAVLPLAMLVGLAVKETVGGAAATVTVADCDAYPPLPVQVRVNCVVALSATVVWEPLVASAPVHPPEAAQLVALLAFQLRTADPPLLTVVGFVVSVTVGAAASTETVTDFAALPPELMHVIV
jgi:hypothetical protein